MRDPFSPHEILKLFEKQPGKTFRLHELMAELGLRSGQGRDLKCAIRALERTRKIVHLKQNRFALATHSPISRDSSAAPKLLPARAPRGAALARISRNVVTGRLIGHRDGYGFVVPDQSDSGRDIFVPRGGLGSAMHGDRVEVQVARSKSDWRSSADGRLEGRVVRVLGRAQKTVVGEFHVGPRYNYVLPFDRRIACEIVIPRGQEWQAREPSRQNRQFGGESEGGRERGGSAAGRGFAELEGSIVDAEITDFPEIRGGGNPRGRILEVLGQREDFGVDVEIMIRKFHLPHRFPDEALAEASAQAQAVSAGEREGRRDFRPLPIVTIDGETAKDFDDAVYVERLSGGRYLLQVHIADVAHYVGRGTALDREARLRGTSVYFPDRAVPMLPLELSNGICSLNPRLDRLVMSALMEIDGAGNVIGYELLPGVIRSAERMTYTAVRDVLAGEPAACERYRALAENFKLMEELARILNRRRDQRGSIDFDLPEPEIEFDEHGRMIGVTRSERNIAHRIIEEFMLAANETIAGYLESRGVPSLFRLHEKPDPKKVLEFEEIAATFGYSLGVELPAVRRFRAARRDHSRREERYPHFHEVMDAKEIVITPRHYQRLTQRLEGKPEERILSYLMLRSLKQARYSEENVGHFALASATYTHFTSPIRRYPDLIVHRILKGALRREAGSARAIGGPPRGSIAAGSRRTTDAGFLTSSELYALALETSEAERRAQEAERELMDWKKVRFMSERLGEKFDALVIGLTKHGFFVELVDLFVEGFVPLDSFDDDRYIYRERLRAVVGERSKKAYHLGGRVRVCLDRIDREGNKLQFSVVP